MHGSCLTLAQAFSLCSSELTLLALGFLINLSPFSDWRDPSWTGIRSVQNGLDRMTEDQRRRLFGDNVIDIQGKSTLSLLVDEVYYDLSAR